MEAMADSLVVLRQEIVNCGLVPGCAAGAKRSRVPSAAPTENVSTGAKPVPGFGDPEARLLVIGLAPGAHGANRTGRVFTGDSSGDWLYRAMHQTGFANQLVSVSRDVGLELKGAWVTASVRCAPPDNKLRRAKLCNAGLTSNVRSHC